MSLIAVDSAAASGRVFTLHPGDVALGDRGDRLETLLGSCVAIVLTDPRRTVGVMCHIVHTRSGAGPGAGNAAFADVARSSMHGLLLRRAIPPSLCEAWVFGGGNMFPDVFSQTHVGDDNARWALDSLGADGIRVLGYDLGGTSYRRLSWTVGSGEPQVVAIPV